MENRDKEEFIENLNAILAGAYSGGNSFAARSARATLQRRDDEGKFAEMFGTMRLVMLLNGLPVAGYGKYVGASTRKGPNGSDNMGWVYINPDKNFPNGKFVRVPMDKVNMFDGEDGGVALLGEDYLKEKGIDPKNPSFSAGMLNFDDLESQDYPPGFLPSPSVGGAFISEDGDISIEPDGNGGWDVIDNLDREAPVRNVATLPDALEQVYEIDKTRTNYEGAEGETKTPETPVAELPTTPEASKADPAGMTNGDLGKEVAQFERVYGGSSGFKMDEETKARYDAVSDEWELRIDENEDQFDNPDFIRDPSKSEATAPVAEIPTADEVAPEITVDRDGEPVNRDDFDKLPLGAEIDVTYTYPDGRKETKTLTRAGTSAGGIGFVDQDGNDVPLQKSDVTDLFRQYSEAERARRKAAADAERAVPQTDQLVGPATTPARSVEMNRPDGTPKELSDFTDEEIAILAENEARAARPRTDGMIGQLPPGYKYRTENMLRATRNAMNANPDREVDSDWQRPSNRSLVTKLTNSLNKIVPNVGLGRKWEARVNDLSQGASIGGGLTSLKDPSDADRRAEEENIQKAIDGLSALGYIVKRKNPVRDETGYNDIEILAFPTEPYSAPAGQDGDGNQPPTPPVTPPTEDGGESIDDVLARLDLVNDDDFINKAVDKMFDPEDPNKSFETDEYGFFARVSIDQIMQEGSFDGFLEVFDPQGGDSEVFEISFPMSGFESLGEQYTREQMAQKIKEALAEAGVGTVNVPQGEQDSTDSTSVVDEVNKDIETDTPIVVDPATETPETSTETVEEILPAPEFRNLGEVINGTPTPAVLRRAKELDGVSENDLVGALAYILSNERATAEVNGKNYAPAVIIAALSSRGFDTDMFIAKKLDEKSGGTENVDALNAYRAQNPDVTREGTDSAKPATAEEALDAFIAGTSQEELVNIYTDATQNGKETVSIALENFGAPEALGSNIVEIPLADFRKRLVDRGFDMDSVDDGFKNNDKSKDGIADDMDATVEELEVMSRNDWRDVIVMGSSEYSVIRFLDEYGVTQEFILGEDGKWYDTSKPLDNKRLNKGKDAARMIRYIEQNADKDELIEITDGSGYDDSGELVDEEKSAFSFSSPEEESLTEEDALELSRWRHISYADLKKMLALQKAGVNIDIMDKMQELFPNSERRSDTELVTETHEYTSTSGADKGTKYKFEVVVTKTPNEYYYTYVRRINTKNGEVYSSRAGRMNQSALGLFRTYRREMTKFHSSFFKKNSSPSIWFSSGATKIRMKKDVVDPDTGKYTHEPDLQLDRNTTASVLNLLGATPSSTQEVDRASDLVMREIFRYLSKYRHDNVWMMKAVDRLNNGAMFKEYNLGIDLEYLYAVAGAYDAHILNQQAISTFGNNISFDQRTPLDIGDTVDYVPSFKVGVRRRGKVIERLGFVDAQGGYRYTDYIRVQWEDGRQQITAARNNRLVETATGTDGSERVNYKDGFTDPRADYGTELTGTDARDLLPQPIVVPAPAEKPERQTATRNDVSDLVLPDGTVIPEKPLGQAGGFTPKRADRLLVGDFVPVANDDLAPVMAPVVSDPVVSEDGATATVKIAVRQSDGTYTVESATYSISPGNSVMVKIYGDPAENSATPAQLNEIFELLATKNPDVSSNFGLASYFLGVMEGKDMSGIYSREEVADIIQELRSSPDLTPAKPIDQATGLARAVSEDEERNGNPDLAQQLGDLADQAAVVGSQGDGTATPQGGAETLASRVAQTASTINLGSFNLKQDDRKALPANRNPSNVKIDGTNNYNGTKPTEEASALKNQMMEFGSEAWGIAQQRVVDELRQRGYEGIKTYEDVATAELALVDAVDKIREAASFSLGRMTSYGYTEEEVELVIQKMTSEGYIDEYGSTDLDKIRKLGETLTSDAPYFDDLRRPYSTQGSALLYLMANSPETKEKVETILRNRQKALKELSAQRETISKFNKDVQIAHDKATVDTLKELGVEFDNVSMSALGIRSSFGGSSVTDRSQIGKAIEEAFDRVPRAILLQLAEIMQNNKMQLVVAPTNGRGHMLKRFGHYKIAVSKEHGRSPEMPFQSAYENPYTDVFLHELWHVIQEVSPNVSQLEHAWLYDRLVSKDKDGNDVLPRLASSTGSTRLGKEKGFGTVNGFVSNYLLKQYGQDGIVTDSKNFFSPNNKYSEVATMVMQDIFGHNGNSSSGSGMVVYASKHNGRAFAANSGDIFQDESTGKWYTDKEMTDEIKNAKTYGRPREDFDEQVKHFGMGLLLLLSDWSPTQGLGSKSETKKYEAEDLFFDMATGKWYTDSSKTTEIPSADVIG